MNRLILVGNGFDLAHGLRTSYKDFIFWYLDSCFNGAGIYANGEFYEDELVNVSILEHYRFMDLRAKANNIGISRYLYDNGLLNIYLKFGFYDDLDTIGNAKELFQEVSKIISHEVVFKCSFFKRLIDSCLECGWVDIEQEYFDALKKYNDSNHSHDLDYIRTINKNFEFLKGKLEEYLLIEEARGIEVIPELMEAMRSDFSISDFDTAFNREDVTRARNTIQENGKLDRYKLYLLNFNYTNALRKYYKKIANTEQDDYEVPIELMNEYYANRFHSFSINHIHGELKNPINPIIFGFGDEHDKEYLKFEEQKNNTLFEHVKSYHYLKTSNYRNLMRFLNLDHYQVFIIGHSCGLSDRTMFKEIFDHDNCKSVRIFHYNDFFDKSINLSRHFSDKGRMCKLVVEFNSADAINQGNNS